MRVYLETNFLLELALLRDQREACEHLLAEAEGRRIHLAIPAFSIGESLDALERRTRQRHELQSRLNQELKELSRSAPYNLASRDFQALTRLLAESGTEEKSGLDQALRRVLSSAELIPIDSACVERSIDLRTTHGLSSQDALVFASVLTDLEKATPGNRCFVTQNSNDFSGAVIRSDLQALRCRLFFNFQHFVSHLTQPS